MLALAQTPLPPIIDPTGRSGSPPPLEKEKPLPPKPPPLIAPPVPPPEERKPKGPVVRVFVRNIRIEGSTVFTPDELAKITEPYLNRELTFDDLEALRLTLTVLYINRGYVTSGAVIPATTVAEFELGEVSDEITIQIIEGQLTRIEIEQVPEGRWFRPNLRPSYLQDRIALGAGPPVNVFPLQQRLEWIARLEKDLLLQQQDPLLQQPRSIQRQYVYGTESLADRLQLLQQDSRIQRLNAELRPGIARGENELKVKVAENNPWKVLFDFNNYQTPVVGAERGLATVMNQNLTGNGDLFSFTYGRSAGVDPIIDTFYTVPLTARDTTFTASYRRNDFIIIEAPFKVLEIDSDAEIIGSTLRHPVYKTINEEFALAVTGEYLHNKIRLLGEGFEFIPGMTNGVGNVFALRFIQEWVTRTSSSVFAIRSRFSVGLDLFDATVNAGPVADGQFFAWLGQVQAVKRLDQLRGLQLLGRMDLQIADDRLFPLEQVPVGGRFSVRGYRENTLVRDNAFIVSAEARLPVIRSAAGEDVLQLAAFSDAGRAWNAKGTTGDPHGLVSVGLGLRWSILPQERARFEVYWGIPLNFVATPERNLQDHGIHLQLVWQVFPW